MSLGVPEKSPLKLQRCHELTKLNRYKFDKCGTQKIHVHPGGRKFILMLYISHKHVYIKYIHIYIYYICIFGCFYILIFSCL